MPSSKLSCAGSRCCGRVSLRSSIGSALHDACLGKLGVSSSRFVPWQDFDHVQVAAETPVFQ